MWNATIHQTISQIRIWKCGYTCVFFTVAAVNAFDGPMESPFALLSISNGSDFIVNYPMTIPGLGSSDFGLKPESRFR